MQKIFLILTLLLNFTSAFALSEFDLYTELKLEENGLSFEVFSLGLRGFNKINNYGFAQKEILAIADFYQSSNNKRLFIIDLKNRLLLDKTYVAHGKNSGEEFATDFSNEHETNKSSFGFYLTLNEYIGKNGLSIRMSGLEKGYNHNAFERAIVIHGAAYVSEDFILQNGRLGRSFGCPAIPLDKVETLIPILSGGAVLFIYYPDADYLENSYLLN